MIQNQIRSGVAHVGLALRTPEDFVERWHRGEAVYSWWVWIALAVTAIAGTTTYGMTMGMLGGPARILNSAFTCTLAAGLAWAIPLPALYILNSFSGSRLPLGTTVLAALVTTSWGGLAMIASIPINWLFTVAIPHPLFVLATNLTVFAGVGVAMIDVFRRVLTRLEPERGAVAANWLWLVGTLGCEMFYAFGLFDFTRHV